MTKALVIISVLFFSSGICWTETLLGDDGSYLLISNPLLKNTAFSNSVVLVVRHAGNNVVGIIINKPTEFKLENLIPDIEVANRLKQPVFYGGPSRTGTFTYLFESAFSPGPALPVGSDVWMGVDPALFLQLISKSDNVKKLRVFMGYSGWFPGQLEAEVNHGMWYVIPAETKYLFHTQPDIIWQELVDRFEGLWVKNTPQYIAMSHKL